MIPPVGRLPPTIDPRKNALLHRKSIPTKVAIRVALKYLPRKSRRLSKCLLPDHMLRAPLEIRVTMSLLLP